MKQAIYNYLREELYPYPSCNHCQYSDPSMKRVPCNQCEHEGDKYKLHKGHEADLRRMARDILKIAKNSLRITYNEAVESKTNVCGRLKTEEGAIRAGIEYVEERLKNVV